MPADAAKRLISSFLRTWFEYNPDAHVRSGYDEAAIKKDVAPAQIEGLGEAPHDKTDPPGSPSPRSGPPPGT
jgi:hypothetical protein